MKIKISNGLTLSDIPENLFTAICEKLTIPNPKYLENERMGYWNGETSKTLRFYEQTESRLMVPRGYIRQLINLCRRFEAEFYLDDQRRALPETVFTFNGQLKPFQQDAVDTMLSKDFGTLSAPTGSGKTVVALYMIAERKQPALIVVHTKELLTY